jgi:ribonuclease-3 family protein
MLDIRDMTTPALAYLGDSVLEVCVRTYLVRERGLSTSAHLNSAALDFVRATAQSRAMANIEPHLTQEEAVAYRRGRNMGHGNVPKSASVAEYRRATGMETLFGYLSLKGDTARIDRLFRIGYGLDGCDTVGETIDQEVKEHEQSPCKADNS